MNDGNWQRPSQCSHLARQRDEGQLCLSPVQNCLGLVVDTPVMGEQEREGGREGKRVSE